MSKSRTINDISEYTTVLKDKLDKMNVDFRMINDDEEHWRSVSDHIQNNPFGYKRDVNGRLWFFKTAHCYSVTRSQAKHLPISSCSALAENQWPARRIQTYHDWTASSI